MDENGLDILGLMRSKYKRAWRTKVQETKSKKGCVRGRFPVLGDMEVSRHRKTPGI